MQLEEGLNTGPVYRREIVAISASTTAAALRRELLEVGTQVLVEELRAGLGDAQPQLGEPTYAAKIRAEELQIDWSRPPTELDRLVRLGGAWTTLRRRRLRIVASELIDSSAPSSNELIGDCVGGMRLLTVQPEGRAAMPFGAFARGARLEEIEQLGGTNR